MVDVECVLDARAELGECPVWSAREQALYWVDIRAPALHRLHVDTGAARTWSMPSRIGSFGLRDAGEAGGAAPMGPGRQLGSVHPPACARTRPRPCFGGPDLRTIFVTSLRHDLPADVLAEKPLSGGIFAVPVDVPGVPVAGFAG